MDLQDATDCAFWALWLTKWQGVCRGSNLLCSAAGKGQAWKEQRNGHPGRVDIETVFAEEGFGCTQRVRLSIKLSKTDTKGEKSNMRTFLANYTPGALSAGRELIEMLDVDRSEGNPKDTHLLRKPRTGWDITLNESRRHLQQNLKYAGISTVGISG